jgi:hypothetical protein
MTPTRTLNRKIRALMRRGWTDGALQQLCHVSQSHLDSLRARERYLQTMVRALESLAQRAP